MMLSPSLSFIIQIERKIQPLDSFHVVFFQLRCLFLTSTLMTFVHFNGSMLKSFRFAHSSVLAKDISLCIMCKSFWYVNFRFWCCFRVLSTVSTIGFLWVEICCHKHNLNLQSNSLKCVHSARKKSSSHISFISAKIQTIPLTLVLICTHEQNCQKVESPYADKEGYIIAHSYISW